jgi:transposase InsO family protein
MVSKKEGRFGKNEGEKLRRFQMIAPLLDDSQNPVTFNERKSEIAERAGISVRTVERYLDRFKAEGIDGLGPKTNGRPGTRVIPPETLAEAIAIRKEHIKRSVSKIIRTLEYEGKVRPGEIKRSTLQDQLNKAGFDKETVLRYSDGGSGKSGRRFQRGHRNDLWQADTKHGIYIGKRKTYLVVILDDATRFVTHAEFYYSDSAESVMDCFKKAIVSHGTPKMVYVDNGRPYKNKAIDRLCGLLSIGKIHTKPYNAQSKGKVERFHRHVDAFIGEIRLKPVNDLSELNTRWLHYLEEYYQNVEHAGIPDKASPRDAFYTDGEPLRLVQADRLDEACLMAELGRKVDKSGCVNFRGRKWMGEGLGAFIGRKGNIVWDPSDESRVWAEMGNFPLIPLKPVEIKEWVAKTAKPPADAVNPPPNGSRVLDAAEKSFRRKREALERALGAPSADGLATGDDGRKPGQPGPGPQEPTETGFAPAVNPAMDVADGGERKTSPLRFLSFKDLKDEG